MEVMGQGHSQEETWTWPPPDREESGAVFSLLWLLLFPSSSPLCAGEQRCRVEVLGSECPSEPPTFR